MKNILFFDTETTGLPVNFNAHYTDTENWPRLVQLAWQQYRGETPSAEGCLIVAPDDWTIPEAASRIHGITTERAILEGCLIWEVLNIFGQALSISEMVVAHNYWFDFPIVAAEMVRVNHHKVVLLEKTPWCCTKESGTDLCKIPKLTGYYNNSERYKKPSLDELHQFLFNEPIEGREVFHDAMIDVRATARCYFEMQSRLIDPNYTKATIL